MRAGRLVMNSGNAQTQRHIRPTLGLSWSQGRRRAREEAIKVASQAMVAKASDKSGSTMSTRMGARGRSTILDMETLSLRSGTGRCQSEQREGLKI